MQIELHPRKGANDTLATGLLVGLWLGDVLGAAEYWLLQGGVVTFRSIAWLVRRWALIVGAAMVGVFLGTGAAATAHSMDQRVRSAKLNLMGISNAAELYRIERGYSPATLDNLVPRFLKELHTDPWGRNYVLYRGPGGMGFVSAGPDRELGTADDVVHIVSQH